jgi:hypothetical protein
MPGPGGSVILSGALPVDHEREGQHTPMSPWQSPAEIFFLPLRFINIPTSTPFSTHSRMLDRSQGDM